MDTGGDGYAAQLAHGKRLLSQAFAAMDAGQTPDLESLRGVLGVRLEPPPWSELVSLVADGSVAALGALGRSPAQLKQYHDHTEKVARGRYASVTDYLYCKVFGCTASPGPDGRLAAEVPPGFGAERRVVWRENDFPYLLEPGTQHHNIWSSQALGRGEIEELVAEHRPAGAWDAIAFVNPPVLMSVPLLWHAHVFSRRKDGGGGEGGGGGGGGAAPEAPPP